jgi:hypothetical protein
MRLLLVAAFALRAGCVLVFETLLEQSAVASLITLTYRAKTRLKFLVGIIKVQAISSPVVVQTMLMFLVSNFLPSPPAKEGRRASQNPDNNTI